MKKRILVISWFFPPINSSEGIVTYKLLNNSEYDYDVFMQKNNSDWSYGNSDDIKINDNIHRISSIAQNLDEFYTDAIRFYSENKDKYDIVMTRSMPEVSHMIGLDIKKINPDIIWIASFGDPIGNNPFTLKAIKYDNPNSWRNMGLSSLFSFKRIIKSIVYRSRYKNNYKRLILKNNKLQASIINTCNYVIYNSENQKNYMLKDYENKDELEKKTVILPHSYDDNLYTDEKKNNAKMIFSYVGHLDDIRTPHSLFLAIKKLKDIDVNLSYKVEFHFYGNLSDKEKIFLLDNELLDVVKIKKTVTYLKSLEVMQNSDWLIHIDANISDIIEENIFFAAKIADYIGSGSPILGITMINGISADILRNYNALCLENSEEEIFNYLYLIINEGYKKELNMDYRENYNAVVVAKKFDKLITKINKERSE